MLAVTLKGPFLDAITPAEVGFLMTLLQRGRAPSPKQRRWIADIRGRLRRRGAEIP